MELQRLKIVTIERDCEMELQRLKTDLCSLADISHSGQRFLPLKDSGRALQSSLEQRDCYHRETVRWSCRDWRQICAVWLTYLTQARDFYPTETLAGCYRVSLGQETLRWSYIDWRQTCAVRLISQATDCYPRETLGESRREWRQKSLADLSLGHEIITQERLWDGITER